MESTETSRRRREGALNLVGLLSAKQRKKTAEGVDLEALWSCVSWKESERYSKNASSQGTLPLALSRCRFFSSSSETLRLAISGSEFIALYTVATSPPTMTW